MQAFLKNMPNFFPMKMLIYANGKYILKLSDQICVQLTPLGFSLPLAIESK